MTVLVTGSRDWTNAEALSRALLETRPALVIHGGAPGADTLAGRWAEVMGIPAHVEYADWNVYGKAAGPIRNRKMLDMKPDLVLAFHENLEKSKGTKHCVMEALKRGITVRIIMGDEQ